MGEAEGWGGAISVQARPPSCCVDEDKVEVLSGCERSCMEVEMSANATALDRRAIKLIRG